MNHDHDWDREYREGKWDALRDADEEVRYAILAGCIVGREYKAPAAVLDLGCGPGVLRDHLSPESIHRYVGVDLSVEAVEQARSRGHERSVYVAAPVETWASDGDYDAIVFNEGSLLPPASDRDGRTVRPRAGELGFDLRLDVVSVYLVLRPPPRASDERSRAHATLRDLEGVEPSVRGRHRHSRQAQRSPAVADSTAPTASGVDGGCSPRRPGVAVRVLVLHSRYLSGAVSGENRVVEDELRALREAGHDIRDWQPSISADASRVAMAVDAIWSRSATSEVARLVREHRPDVVHVHSLYPRLSPAILRALPRRQPTVMTLHNFRLMCLPATYLRDGSICEACANRTPWRGVVHACYRGSRSASGALATSLVLHRSLATFSRIDRFLAVSNFVRDKYVDVGFEPSRVRVKFNFAWPSERRGDAGGPLLFLGRIAPEKGLDVLLRAKPTSSSSLSPAEATSGYASSRSRFRESRSSGRSIRPRFRASFVARVRWWFRPSGTRASRA